MTSTPSSLATRLDALDASVDRLRGLITGLDDAAISSRAYASEWTIADELSHLGSGAVISRRRIEGALADDPMPDDFAPSVWAAWNAKTPREKVDDGLEADRAFLDRLLGFTDAEQARIQLPMGPMTLDFAGLVGMRLNEHALHTWDVAVALDPTATIPADATAIVIDNLELIGRFSGKPTGTEHTVVVATVEPERAFTVTVTTESVALAAGGSDPAVTLPAEAFVRLVYGRLDAEHTPTFAGSVDALDLLRRTFRGV